MIWITEDMRKPLTEEDVGQAVWRNFLKIAHGSVEAACVFLDAHIGFSVIFDQGKITLVGGSHLMSCGQKIWESLRRSYKPLIGNKLPARLSADDESIIMAITKDNRHLCKGVLEDMIIKYEYPPFMGQKPRKISDRRTAATMAHLELKKMTAEQRRTHFKGGAQ